LLQFMQAQGADISGVTVLEKVPTGFAVIHLDEEKENAITIIGGANMHYPDL